MDIHLKNIMPFPLASIKHSENSIWGNQTTLNHGSKIMLNASSGKGKSTFTNTVFGLRKDYEGTLYFDSSDTKKFTVREWTNIRKEKIAVIFQDLQLFHNLSVRENLFLKNSISDIFSENELKLMLEKLEIDNKWDEKCGILSMGQQQRVAIIRALCQPYEWLILDEPFSHLDKQNSMRCLELINERCMTLNAGFILTTLGDNYGYSFDKELIL